MTPRPYDTDRYLAPTTQFYFCALPLRLDTYASCSFGCSYCFAASRGGARPSMRGQFPPESLRRRLARIERSASVASVVDEFILRRQPIHLGGMSDPFSPQERREGVSLAVLRILAKHGYPTVVSTKGTLFAHPEYLDVLVSGNFFIQVSFSALDDSFAERIERGTPSPSQRLDALAIAAASGVRVSMRHQPVLPGRERDIRTGVVAAANAGCSHYGLEFLKVAVEKSSQRRLGTEVDLVLGEAGVRREGREWLLPLERRLPWVLEARRTAHAVGLSFGAADNDLLPLSDGDACCSGADLCLPEPGSPYRHNYLEAVRRAAGGIVRRESVHGEWVPKRTLARFVNSRSRLARNRGASMVDYIDHNWNGRANGPSPGMFAGVRATDEMDNRGFRIYELDGWLLAALHERGTASRAEAGGGALRPPVD